MNIKLYDQYAGQLLAMQIAIKTLITTHPAGPDALAAIDEELDRFQTSGLYSTSSEEFLGGFQSARKRMGQ